jgi:hypothetical protein
VVLLLPVAFLLGDGEATTDDLMVVVLALLLSAIPWFCVAMMATMRAEVAPDALTLYGLGRLGRTIARDDLDRVRAERRATLTRGVLFASPQLHVTLSGTSPDGEPIDLRLGAMMLDVADLLRVLAPWIAACPSLVQDDETRAVLATLQADDSRANRPLTSG